MTNASNSLSDYDYTLPPECIAVAPASPRDAAKLMVYERATQKVTLDTFQNLAAYLPPNSLVVINETKVLPARITVTKDTGGKAELLYLTHTDTSFTALSNKPLRIRGTVTFPNGTVCTVDAKQTGEYTLVGIGGQTLIDALHMFGKTPIPPYIKHSPLAEHELRQEYQSVFAKHLGSSAAPTASLHVTQRVLDDIEHRGHHIVPITLHVGLGTFAPVTKEHLDTKTLHEESYEIPPATAKAIQDAKHTGRPVVAVGTTVVRALESASASGIIQAGAGTTRLFIQPGFQFNVVDHIITNFHVPRSSLLMLVAAFTGKEKLFELYNQAMSEEFRFFSFGDGMLIR